MMMGPSCRVAVLAAITASCSAGNNAVDPGELELRDLLGISPEIASAWTPAQRASARRVLIAALSADEPAEPAADPRALDPTTLDLDDRIAALLAADDDGADPLGVVRIAVDATGVTPRPTAAVGPAGAAMIAPVLGVQPATSTAAAMATPPAPTTGAALPARSAPAATGAAELWLAPAWDRARGWGHLPGRSIDVFLALADDAGHPGGPFVVVPRPRLAVIAAYIAVAGHALEPRLAVNPVLLAALEPAPDERATSAALQRHGSPEPPAVDRGAPGPRADTTAVATAGGNPYSFYGSIGECAFVQRTRCEACLPGNACAPVTDTSDGNAECMALAADSGRGYFLLCINLALAITSVEGCTGDAAPACARDPHASDSLGTLDSNAEFLDDPTCAGALDACLAEIYGAPGDPFPGVDGGAAPPSPPRSTTVTCGDSCDSSNNNCTASPSCDCSGPSCNNSLSCDSACSSSNDQSGCDGNCDACTSSGGGGGGDDSGCGGDSSSSGDGCGGGGDGGGSCGDSSCGDSSCSSGDSCGSCNSDGGSCSGSSGSSSSGCGGDCNSSSSNNGCGSCSGSGGGSSKCNVAASDARPGAGVAMSLLWAFMPVAVAALIRRRAQRHRQPASATEPASATRAALEIAP